MGYYQQLAYRAPKDIEPQQDTESDNSSADGGQQR